MFGNGNEIAKGPLERIQPFFFLGRALHDQPFRDEREQLLRGMVRDAAVVVVVRLGSMIRFRIRRRRQRIVRYRRNLLHLDVFFYTSSFLCHGSIVVFLGAAIDNGLGKSKRSRIIGSQKQKNGSYLKTPYLFFSRVKIHYHAYE